MTETDSTTAVVTVRAKPWTRVEALPDTVSIALPDGYVSAYYRKRNNLAVLRASDNSHYLVLNTSTGECARVHGTREASELMSAIRKGSATLNEHCGVRS